MGISPDRILYRDEHVLAVAKRGGELVVRGAGPLGKLPLLDFLRQSEPGLRPLHRLDFETSGVVLFARTKAVAEAVREDAFDGWRKEYRTLVAGVVRLDRGTIERPLPARAGGEPRGRPGARRGGAPALVPALTQYEVLERFASASYLACTIETGRYHQIRRHLTLLDHPLLLDDVYGDRGRNQAFARRYGYRRFFLHAFAVELTHPVTGQPLRVEAPLPRAFAEILERLRTTT
jgi:23S rRNA pseudouridine955/2504/2580 synthase